MEKQPLQKRSINLRGVNDMVTLENPLIVRVLSHMPGKDAKLVCVAGA